MKILPAHVIVLWKRLALVYFILFCCRLIFFVFNSEQFAGLPISAVLQAFLSGLIFDSSAIAYLLSPFILLHLIPVPVVREQHWYQQVLQGYFVITCSAFAVVNLIDTAYYPFQGKRSGLEVFAPAKDIGDQTLSYVFTYWYLFVLLFALITLSIRWYPKLRVQQEAYSFKKFGAELLVLVLMAGLGVLAARGGTGLKPVSIFDAARFADVRLSAVTLNTPFQMMRTANLNDLEEVDLINTEVATRLFNPDHRSIPTRKGKGNIVLIIMESMGKEYIGYYNKGKGYTPFLDSLIRKSEVWEHAYANGKRSIEGIPAILASMPSIMPSAYINTRFQNNRLRGIGSYLAEMGYESMFYHGCRNGTMGFNSFVALTGSGSYYGMDEYPEPADFDGNWGIYDGPYLQYVVQELNAKKLPFFCTVFTQSAHHPYPVPESLRGQFPKGTLPIHESIGYADYALREFMTAAGKQPWYQNTTFVFIADHSSENEQPYYQSQYGRYEIPFFVFTPGGTYKQHGQTFQQADVMPYLLQSHGVGTYFAWSNFTHDSASSNGFAIQFVNGVYQLTRYPWVCVFDGHAGTGLYQVDVDSMLTRNLWNRPEYAEKQEEMDRFVRSYIQQYNHRLITNSTSD